MQLCLFLRWGAYWWDKIPQEVQYAFDENIEQADIPYEDVLSESQKIQTKNKN